MKIELKKLRVYKHLSEETTAFSADVYVNGKNVGTARNSGEGGETNLQFYHLQDSPLRKLCDEAYAWAAALPPIKLGGGREWKMDLPTYIDDLVAKS